MHQILIIFAQMLEIVAQSDLASVLCARKFSFAPRGFNPQKCPLLGKIALLSLYLQNRASDFDNFCIDVRDSCYLQNRASDFDDFYTDVRDICAE